MPTRTPLPSLARLAAIVILACPLSVTAARFHLQPVLPSEQQVGDAVCISAGGNLGAYPDADGTVPNANGFFLAESSIGYCGPTTQGGPTMREDLNAAAAAELDEGTSYKSEPGTGSGNWSIVFPGVIDVSTGNDVTTDQNFFPDQVVTAINYYRAVALAYPNDLDAKVNFLTALREFMAPHTFAGHNAFARATKERIIHGGDDAGNGVAAGQERIMLEKAEDLYGTSVNTFAGFFGSLDNMLAGFPDPLPPGLTEESAAVGDLRNAQREFARAYSWALGYQAETELRRHRLRYFLGYQAPSAANAEPLSLLLGDINEDLAALQAHLILAASLENEPWFPAGEFSTSRTLSAMLADLRRAVRDGDLKFVGLDSSVGIQARSYHPQFIPFFFDPLLFPDKPTSLSGLLAFARPLANASIQADQLAENETGRVETNLASLAQQLNDLFEQYRGQLGQLCGWTHELVSGVNTRTPDVVGAIFPPERREDYDARSPEDKGLIGEAWRTIELAEIRKEAALLAYENVLDAIEVKTETWRKIKESREDLIQNVIYPTGEKLAELERAIGEERARYQEYLARLAKKKRKRSLIGGAISSVASALTHGFSWGALAQGTAGLTEAVTAYSNAGLDIKGIQAGADLERKLGELSAKRVELQTLQSAAFQFQNITEDGYRTEESVQLLLLEAKAAEINILSAELEIDQEYSRLASLLNRVAFLLQEQASSLSLVDTNPLNSPDFRLVRNKVVRDAEERFILAQEWAFLAGRAASYVAYGTSTTTNVTNINTEILQARSGLRLDQLLDLLNAQIGLITLERGTRAVTETTVSLRDHIVQRNSVIRDASGNPTTQTFPWEAQTAIINGTETNGATQEISDAAWRQFLQDHIVQDPAVGAYLEIPFRLSLDRWGAADRSHIENPFVRSKNPLFSATDYGRLIWYKDSDQTSAFGVRVDLLGNFQNIGGTGQNVVVNLTAEGTSYVRDSPFNTNPTGGVRTFQFGRDRFGSTITASVNGIPANQSNAQLHERSPANDRWVLRIFEGEINDRFLQQLDQCRDIRIRFAISSFSPQ